MEKIADLCKLRSLMKAVNYLSPPPPVGVNGTSNKQENPRQGAPSGGLPPIARGGGFVIDGVCLVVFLIGRLGRLGA